MASEASGTSSRGCALALAEGFAFLKEEGSPVTLKHLLRLFL
jgi:hypothetical protein